MRALVQFEKTGAAKYISHLDLQRSIQRAIRRAGLPIAYSQGFNPHMQISYATALSLGIESKCEIMELTLQKDIPAKAIMDGMNAALPPGLYVSGCREVVETGKKAQSLASVIMRAQYEITPADPSADCREKIGEFERCESFIVQKRSKKGVNDVNIRPLVYDISCDGGGKITMLLEHTAQSSLNPELLLESLGILRPYSIIRTRLFTIADGNAANIWDGEDSL